MENRILAKFKKYSGMVLIIMGCLFILREFYGNAGAPNIYVGVFMIALGILNMSSVNKKEDREKA